MSTSTNPLKAATLETPLGSMLAVADEDALYVLEFTDYRGSENQLEYFSKKFKAPIIPGKTRPIASIEKELQQYFDGKLIEFKTPLFFIGTAFQKRVWETLQRIPYGTTCSYADLAAMIGRPAAHRAVANANGANLMAVVVPCHRVINSDGKIGGYGGGLHRKDWLLKLEQTN